jgi:hypothetical protein
MRGHGSCHGDRLDCPARDGAGTSAPRGLCRRPAPGGPLRACPEETRGHPTPISTAVRPVPVRTMVPMQIDGPDRPAEGVARMRAVFAGGPGAPCGADRHKIGPYTARPCSGTRLCYEARCLGRVLTPEEAEDTLRAPRSLASSANTSTATGVARHPLTMHGDGDSQLLHPIGSAIQVPGTLCACISCRTRLGGPPEAPPVLAMPADASHALTGESFHSRK